MFCPRCSQEQVSEETKFCSRCGFPLGLVSEILTTADFFRSLPKLKKAKNGLHEETVYIFRYSGLCFFR
jgi:predicted amidophosphoribosyltransferase